MSEREVLLYLFSFILGSVIGSFLNVCIYRLPREESIVFPHSRCTSCGCGIRFYHNIPILGFVMLKGRCADCGQRISFRYPLVELISGIALLGAYWKFGLSPESLFYSVLIFSLIVITFIDLEHMIIPNVITIPGTIIGLIFNALITDWGKSRELLGTFSFSLENFFGVLNEVPFLDSVFGLIVGGGFLFLIAFLYIVIRKTEGMGMGDVKLLAMIGAFLGWRGVVFVMLVSSLVGTLTGLSVILYKKGNLKYALPFGPFLSLAAVIYIFTSSFRLIK
ncbi:MAG: prepilin peptidase [Thermodesulfobacteriota bacterium]